MLFHTIVYRIDTECIPEKDIFELTYELRGTTYAWCGEEGIANTRALD